MHELRAIKVAVSSVNIVHYRRVVGARDLWTFLHVGAVLTKKLASAVTVILDVDRTSDT